jgi:hypothetical protein
MRCVGSFFQTILKSLTTGSSWSSSPLCSALHGGFRGNAATMHRLMTNHLSDSFKLLSVVTNPEQFLFSP